MPGAQEPNQKYIEKDGFGGIPMPGEPKSAGGVQEECRNPVRNTSRKMGWGYPDARRA